MKCHTVIRSKKGRFDMSCELLSIITDIGLNDQFSMFSDNQHNTKLC